MFAGTRYRKVFFNLELLSSLPDFKVHRSLHNTTMKFNYWSYQWKIPFKTGGYSKQRRQWHPTPVLLSGKSHGWRSLVSCSPWGREESDMIERLQFHFPLSCIGEGNGNPLQCSCLENPRDRGAWWAAVYGVAQNRIWLKWLSSSSTVFIILQMSLLSGLVQDS